MRIRIEEEHLAELALVEEVGEIFHGIRANACDVIIFSRVQNAQHFDSVLDVVGNFHTNLHADGNLVGESFTKRDEKPSVAAADYGKSWYKVTHL